MHYWMDIGAITLMAVLVLTVIYVVVPIIRMQMRRQQSRLHTPQPGELWYQDGDLLYIEAVNDIGVEIISWSTDRQMTRWRDTWPEWHQRLLLRVVYFSGTRRELKVRG